jgi:hypothetical protein
MQSTTFYTGTSEQVLNFIRDQASASYQNYVPVAIPGAESVQSIGAIIMDNVALRTEFSDLICRMSYMLVNSPKWKSPFRKLERPEMKLGEFIENSFIDLTKVYGYDMSRAESEHLKIELPDIKASFHYINTARVYPVTISRKQLAKAFTSDPAFNSFVNEIISKMYTSEEYDDYQVTKYMIAREILLGRQYYTELSVNYSPQELSEKFRAISNKFTFMRRDFNIVGVANTCAKNDQNIMISADVDAKVDVNVYAEAFNIQYADMYARKLLYDDFDDFDYERLQEILVDDVNYREFTTDELNLLKKIKAVVFDREWLMLIPGWKEMIEDQNGLGAYRNYNLHVEKCYSINPFANCAIIAENGTFGTINSVNFTAPAEFIAKSGTFIQLAATVVGTNIYSKTVEFKPTTLSAWNYKNGIYEEKATGNTLTKSGFLTIKKDSNTNGISIDAYSVFNPSIKKTTIIGKGV